MRISDWSSDVCSSDLGAGLAIGGRRNLNVLGQIDHDRAWPAGGRDMKCLVDDIAKLGRVLHQIIVLGAVARDADRVAFLKSVRSDQRDRKRVVEGKRVSVRVDRGGSRIIKIKKKMYA